MKLDRYDKLILEALQRDGRISNVHLAGLVSLSESACLRRVRALEESGIIDRSVSSQPSWRIQNENVRSTGRTRPRS